MNVSPIWETGTRCLAMGQDRGEGRHLFVHIVSEACSPLKRRARDRMTVGSGNRIPRASAVNGAEIS